MRTTRAIAFLLSLLCLPLITISAGAKEEWQPVFTQSKNFLAFHAAFENPEYGMIGGHGGEIYRSINHGTDWEEMERPQGVTGRVGFELLADNFAVSTGSRGMAFTTDGGDSWQKFSDTFYPAISFSDKNTGWLIGPDEWIRTQDGLNSWQPIEAPQGLDQIQALSVTSYDSAWIWDARGVLYHTKDSGENWISQNTAEDISNQGYRPNTSVMSMRFNQEGRGTLVMINRSEAFQWLICETEDHGESWKISTIQREAAGTAYISHDQSYITFMEMIDGFPEVTLMERIQ